MNFIVGVIFGIVISTVGFHGVARVLDNGVSMIKDASRNVDKN
jgi:hypothetical protein